MKVNLKNFATIIFDFGGVILDIDPQKTIDAFLKFITLQEVEKIQSNGILNKIEKGEINAEQLYKGINELLGKELSKNDFHHAWNAILLDYKTERIDWIKKLSKTHKLFLLSNTNEIHYRSFSKKLKEEFNVSFNDLFIKSYLSFEMGLLKPDAAIYKKVIEEQSLNPSKTLFIEDTAINAKAAEELGIVPLVIPRNGSFYDFLK
ncbi:MAG: HAD-IA family hydrolase [Salinivirgaceae bacterium]|nr:HAD-IA family hydrolase [Salinivirgaceae bacterium]